MSSWDQVPDNEIQSLQSRADSASGVIMLDDALSALGVEMTDEVVDETREFWGRRGVKVDVAVEVEGDQMPAADTAKDEGAESDPNEGRRRGDRLARIRQGPAGVTGVSDPVKMYLREIGRVSLLNAKAGGPARAADRGWGAGRGADGRPERLRGDRTPRARREGRAAPPKPVTARPPRAS
ncbi:MAG: sigma-70 factor domain-containing protein [Microthrixaceae bacterium]